MSVRAQSRDFRRKTILAAARGICAEAGAAGLTARSLAAATGYSPGAIYGYFPSLDELAAELLIAELGDLTRLAKEKDQAMAAKGASAAHRLTALCDLLNDQLGGTMPLLDLAGRLIQRSEPLGDDLDRALNGRIIGLLSALAAPLQSAGLAGPDMARETVTLAALMLGLRLFDRAGRLTMLGETVSGLAAAHVGRLATRFAPADHSET